MAAILLGMAAIVIGTFVWSNREINSLQSAIEVSDAYHQMAQNAGLSSIYSSRYAETGRSEDIAGLRTALLETLRYVALVKETGTEDDRAFLTGLETTYASDMVWVAQAIQATGNGTSLPEAGNDDGPLFEITELLTSKANERREAAIANLDSMRSTTRELSVASMVALALGIPIVVGAFVMTRRYEHKETVRELELERLAQAALTDGLTGLANHRAFQEDLRREVARAARHERPITVAMMDVDDFKEVNDTTGHAKGDAVLAELASLMVYVRGQDRAYRVGGDEFALIMPETSEMDAEAALDRLRSSAETGLRGTSISIGYATTSDAFSPETLRDHADLALYEAKRRGKNQVVAYHPNLSEGEEVTMEKTFALRRTLDRQHVTMWFQPIYHYGAKRLLAFEALLRLPEEPALEGPQEAFRIARRLGKTRELDMLCVAEALRSAEDMPEGVKLFINLDPATMMNSRFSVQDLVDLVVASRFEPSQIVFEVTEQTVAPVKALQAQVEAIRAAGFGMALDDVGTGNAGLELMRLISFDFVKIDRSVIVDASNGGQGRAVILAIVAFARETGAFMIAEGIEDVSLLQGIRLDEPGLRDFWVRGVQGFLLGEPRASIRSFLPPSERVEEPAA